MKAKSIKESDVLDKSSEEACTFLRKMGYDVIRVANVKTRGERWKTGVKSFNRKRVTLFVERGFVKDVFVG